MFRSNFGKIFRPWTSASVQDNEQDATISTTSSNQDEEDLPGKESFQNINHLYDEEIFNCWQSKDLQVLQEAESSQTSASNNELKLKSGSHHRKSFASNNLIQKVYNPHNKEIVRYSQEGNLQVLQEVERSRTSTPNNELTPEAESHQYKEVISCPKKFNNLKTKSCTITHKDHKKSSELKSYNNNETFKCPRKFSGRTKSSQSSKSDNLIQQTNKKSTDPHSQEIFPSSFESFPVCTNSESLDGFLFESMAKEYGALEEYARILSYEQHVKMMSGRKQRPKKYKCPHCDVGFSNNGQLKGHIRIHTGERPYQCDAPDCGKTFTRNEELTRHKRIHSGLRPFPCPECGKRFGRKDHLKKHARTHVQHARNLQQQHESGAFAMYAVPFMFGPVDPVWTQPQYGYPFLPAIY